MAIPPSDLSGTIPGARGAAEQNPDGTLIARLVDELVDAWRRGERPRAERFLAAHPELGEEDAIRLVYEEACLRQEEGEESASSEILARFPGWKSKLALLLDCNRLLRMPYGIEFPETGEELGEFRICSEIGRGALGRTYLASQRSLADRLVVLKITPLDHEEHLSLARLQHMHIMPLYFEQVLADRQFRVLGMPYLGGTTLARIFESLAHVPADQRSGSQVVELLDGSVRDLPTEYPTTGPFREYLGRTTYVHAICFIGECLANALQYAHDRGLVHMDVKASNVLLAGDGQPMLLDFHLAQAPIAPGRAPPDRLGGTPGFMAPEQHDAMAAIRAGSPVPTTVDGRADIYSLGLLLYEALGGDAGPGAGGGWLRRPLEEVNPRVSPGLSDIIAKCLAHDPGDRYSSATALALDLRLHQNDLPLRGVSNRSLAERWRKWRRRRPYAPARILVRVGAAAVVVIGLLVAYLPVWQRDEQFKTAMIEFNDQLKHQHYDEANTALDRGRALAAHLPGDTQRNEALVAAAHRLAREKLIVELHDLVERLRFQFGVNPPSAAEALGLFRVGQEVWSKRDLLARGPSDPRAKTTANASATDGQVETDLLDLAKILAWLRVQRESGEPARQDLRDAVQILREAETQFGPSPALIRDLRSYSRALGETDGTSPAIPTARTAWEHYDLGRSYFQSQEYAEAEAEFRKSIALQPEKIWPHFSRGVCAFRLRRYQEAVASLNVCVALAPRTPECYYNRALALAALGQPEEALEDDTRALALAPAFDAALLNRGILYYQMGRYSDAIADFDGALQTARSNERRGLIYYNRALVHHALKNLPATKANLESAIACGDDSARDLYARLGLK